MARVFIGIPTYNRPDLVQETVKSVASQTYHDWQAVVSDNVSKDEIPKQVREFVEDLDEFRISFHQQTENGGEYGQGRFFFAEAKKRGAEFLVIVHDDDVLEPTYIEKAVEALSEHDEAAFFVSNLTIIGDEGEPKEKETQEFDDRWGRTGTPGGFIDVLDTHMQTGFTPISAAFFRISALDDSGFVDDDLFGCFPFESNLFLRLGERKAKAWFDPERLFQLRWHNGQLTNWGFLNVEEIVENTIKLFERRQFDGENEKKRRQLLSRLHRVGGLHRASQRDASGARKNALAAFRLNPWSPKTMIFGMGLLLVPSILGSYVRARFGSTTYSSC